MAPLSRSMLPPDKPQIRRLVVFCDEDWELLGNVFDERQFRAMIVGVMVHDYCNWLRGQGIVDRETRNAKLSIEECIEHAKNYNGKATGIRW